MHLAIDASTQTAGLALLRPDGTLQSELSWNAGRNHTAELYPALQDLLRQARITPADISSVIIARGPGSFTGIRVGMATAKGLALGLEIPIVGVETLAAAAYPFASSGRPVWAVVDAGRGQVAAAAYHYDNDSGEFRKVAEERILEPEALCDAISADADEALLCGEFPPAVETMVRERLGGRVTIPPAIHRMRRAGYLAVLGWQRLQRGDADDPITVAPLYLRRPAALENRE